MNLFPSLFHHSGGVSITGALYGTNKNYGPAIAIKLEHF